ncbi:MAG: Asp-tRNA(Asn)/Glu-tRNA(Gln) amidotransferase subunit GatC [Patescibacteria group bacterium]|nr:Asp-tRNA(Asn)/Glu-tRNA(Gln) amidotransferase subunit GatC [Patescibacteria group bacterium]MBU1876866.1 Asp-tRNA(Asn)/Glu-tRNA(Gln) amidotransferase subunit GatC [Patescibacteria group bacterium]
MISKKEVEHLAKLARLGLADKELEKMQKEIASILDYFEKLKQVDIIGVEPTTHAVALKNIMRADQKRKEFDSEQRTKLLSAAPETKDNYLKVKAILKENGSY